jgi:hypothetical protein
MLPNGPWRKFDFSRNTIVDFIRHALRRIVFVEKPFNHYYFQDILKGSSHTHDEKKTELMQTFIPIFPIVVISHFKPSFWQVQLGLTKSFGMIY